MKISSAKRVRQSLLSHDHEDTIIEFPEGTRSAKDAANAVGCKLLRGANCQINDFPQ